MSGSELAQCPHGKPSTGPGVPTTECPDCNEERANQEAKRIVAELEKILIPGKPQVVGLSFKVTLPNAPLAELRINERWFEIPHHRESLRVLIAESLQRDNFRFVGVLPS